MMVRGRLCDAIFRDRKAIFGDSFRKESRQKGTLSGRNPRKERVRMQSLLLQEIVCIGTFLGSVSRRCVESESNCIRGDKTVGSVRETTSLHEDPFSGKTPDNICRDVEWG